jgi:hypothetical protein
MKLCKNFMDYTMDCRNKPAHMVKFSVMKYQHVITILQVVQKRKSSHNPARFQWQEFKSATHFIILFYFGYQPATSQPLLDRTTNYNQIRYTHSSVENLWGLEQMQ